MLILTITFPYFISNHVVYLFLRICCHPTRFKLIMLVARFLKTSFLHFNVGINDEASLQGPIEEIARIEAEEAESLLKDLGIPVRCISFCFLLCISCLHYWMLKIKESPCFH